MLYSYNNCYGIFKVKAKTYKSAEEVLENYYEIVEFIKRIGNYYYFKCFSDESVGDNRFMDIKKDGIYYENDK